MGRTRYGSKLYATDHVGEESKRYFTSLRQASFYSLGHQHRGETLARSYAIDQIDFADGDIVIDCGANYGDLRLYFDYLNMNEPIQYVAFEPGVDEFECLSMSLRDTPNCALHDFALGNEDGCQTFYYDPNPANSSLEEPALFTDTYDVAVRTLDTLTKEGLIPKGPIKLLKLEAEGYEPEILQGGLETIQRIEYIAADLGFERGKLALSTAPPVVNMLLRSGFELVAIGSLGDVRLLFKNTFSNTY